VQQIHQEFLEAEDKRQSDKKNQETIIKQLRLDNQRLKGGM